MPRRLIEPPIYLSGAPIDREAVVDACRKTAPAAGLVGSAVLGAIAAYFVPKLIDQALTGWRERGQPDDVEFEVEEPE